MIFWSAFMLGLLGSLHCLGMCGPIAIALPGSHGRLHLVVSRLMYNAGRVLTYTLLGYVAGIAGRSITFAGWQNSLSIAMGAIIIVAILIPRRFVSNLFPSRFFGAVGVRFSAMWKEMFGRGTVSSLLAVGILNGFLPCGLVYVALAASITTGSAVDSLMYMVLFGLGTIPAMLTISLMGQVISTKVRLRLTRVVPIGAVVLGCLLILRGMSLGIPYVSPSNIQLAETTQSCH
jgi:uncharacterized protein